MLSNFVVFCSTVYCILSYSTPNSKRMYTLHLQMSTQNVEQVVPLAGYCVSTNLTAINFSNLGSAINFSSFFFLKAPMDWHHANLHWQAAECFGIWILTPPAGANWQHLLFASEFSHNVLHVWMFSASKLKDKILPNFRALNAFYS